MKLKTFTIALFFLIFNYTNSYSQRNPHRKTVGVHQLDSRFTFSIEKRWSGMADAEEYFYYVKNNTADTYELEIEVDLTLNCAETRPYKLGINRKVYLEPYGEFTPKDDWVHINMITSDREKQKACLIAEGDTYTLYRGHTWQILSVVNITQKRAEEKKLSDLKALLSEADRDLNLNNLEKAKEKYQKVLLSDQNNERALNQIKKIDDLLKKREQSNSFDDIVKQGKEAENRGDLDQAEQLYDDALKNGSNNAMAQSYKDNINRIKANKKREQDQKAEKSRKEKGAEDKKIEQNTADKLNDYPKNLERKKEIEEIAVKKQMDSISDALDKENRNKFAAAEKKRQDDLREEEKKKEEEKDQRRKKRNSDRRSYDAERIAGIENIMKYDPEKYYESLKEANEKYREALDFSDKIYDAEQLKREWWDNNSYIQIFADDLYETQRQENYTKSRNLSHQQLSMLNSAKSLYIDAMLHVDKDSDEFDHLNSKIDDVNKSIELHDMLIDLGPEMEQNRKKNREMVKSFREAARLDDVRSKTESAFAILDQRAGNQYENIVAKVELQNKFNQAHQKYRQDAAIAGFTQAVATNAIINNDGYVKGGNQYALVNTTVSLGYGIKPMLMNITANDEMSHTKVDEMTYCMSTVGLDIWWMKTRHVDLNLGFYGGLGTFPMEGISNLYTKYGSKLNFDFGFKRFKIATEASYEGHDGSQDIDYDVAASNAGYEIIYSNKVGTGSFSYTTIKMASGFKIDTGNEDESSHILLMAVAEQPSFYKQSIRDKPIVSYTLEILFNSGITINAGYAQNYFVAGQKNYTISELKSKDYYFFSFGKTWTL